MKAFDDLLAVVIALALLAALAFAIGEAANYFIDFEGTDSDLHAWRGKP